MEKSTKKKVIIGGLLVVIGGALYLLWKRKQKSVTESSKDDVTTPPDVTTPESGGNSTHDRGGRPIGKPKAIPMDKLPKVGSKYGFKTGSPVYVNPKLNYGINIYSYPNSDKKNIVRSVKLQAAPIGQFVSDSSANGWIKLRMGNSDYFTTAGSVTPTKP